MPADTARESYDEAVRRRIALERYSTTQARKVLRFLKELETDLVGKLAQAQADGRSRLTIRQQEQLLASVREVAAEVYAKVQDELRSGLAGLAGVEHERAVAELRSLAQATDAATNLTVRPAIAATTQALSATAAFEIAAARPMQGALLRDWLADLESSHLRRIEQALRISFAEGENLYNATRRLRDAGLRNGRGLEALVRTANTHVSSAIDQAVAQANADLIEGVEWVSVLDSRTTDICRARDGKVYPVDSGPRPPAHIGCRSVMRKVLKGMEPLPRETYGEWLKRQSAAVQDDILGPARGRLFRSGRMTVDRFVDMRGRRLTLEELGAG